MTQSFEGETEKEKLASVSERFTAYQTSLESAGVQSQVALGEVDGLSVIKKTAGSELTVETLTILASAVPDYRKSLIEAGLHLPDNLSIRVANGLELIDGYLGGRNIDVMIRMKDSDAEQTWIEMVKQICAASDVTNQSRAMIDVNPGNFVMSGDTLFYVDLFPPMLRDSQGLITPWVPEVYKRDHHVMSFNFGDTRGQITKLLAGSRLKYKEMFEYLKAWTLQTIDGNLPSQTTEYIREQTEKGFPDMNLFYSDQDMSQRIQELGI